MKSVDLNKNWKIVVEDSEYACNLPHDALIGTPRDHSCAFGEYSSYYPAKKARFIKQLPSVKDGQALLTVSGVCGYADVLLNGENLGCIHSYAPAQFDVTGKLVASHNTLELDIVSVPGMSDKYIGLGVAGGVELVTSEEVDFVPYSLYITSATSGDKTYADVHIDVRNAGIAKKMLLECVVINARGKRAGKKQRKIYVRANTEKSYTVRVRLPRPYEWTPSDPYMYSVAASLVGDGVNCSAETRFGIVTRALNNIRGMYLNGKNVKLYGAYVSHADAVLGGVSNYSNEIRRFAALKDVGYNAVHFVECPTETTLNALDDLGMYAFVDIFSRLGTGKAPLDSHIFFNEENLCRIAELSVKALRNHPCVALLGVADDVPECYGRNGGYDVINSIVGAIKAADDVRPVTISAGEFVPTQCELEAAGVRKHLDNDAAKINAGREKNLFESLTAPAFDAVDICGLNYLHQLYGAETIRHNRLVVGARTSASRAFDSLEETEKNLRVVGDFNDCGIDYPGGGKPDEHNSVIGDLDVLCDGKPQSVYKSIMLGAHNIAYITVLDPDTQEPVNMWNWPRFLGQQVTVQVYTSGDVVALYLDGRLLGRKLAGKVNKHIATFVTDYYPGALMAVSYYKGVECARTTLRSAGSPKLIRLWTADKNLYYVRDDLAFVHVEVCDREGNLVPFAMRELTASVTGGTLLGFINADPMLRKSAPDICPAYNGRALCVVRPDPGEEKTVIKITGEGLLAAKMTFKIKD